MGEIAQIEPQNRVTPTPPSQLLCFSAMSSTPPAVSAILLSYNCEHTIGAALESVLAQDCEPMEIIVSDDASTDDTWQALRQALHGYTGPHHLTLRRRDTNAGSKSAHLNDVFPLATGRYLVSFDGDDISEPGRVSAILAAFRADENISAVFSDYAWMEEGGAAGTRRGVRHPPRGTPARRWFARVDAFGSGTTLAIRRDVVETFGPLAPDINEDVVLPFRASLLGEVCFIDQPLVRVRRWAGSLTAAEERLSSIEHYRAWWQRGIARARRQLETRQADLATAERQTLVDPAELAILRAIATTSLAEAESSAGLVSPSLLARLRCFARQLRPGTDPEDLLLGAGLTFAPGLYLRYKRRRRS
jgi:GT2 family glycosyltransferase